MSLRDLACYTLNIQPSSTDPNIVELVEVEGVKREPRYARVKEPSVGPGENYTAGIYDYLTGAKLASTGYGVEKGPKSRRLQLHGPDEEVAFDLTGRMGFEWTFIFQGNKFRWTREILGKDYICSLDRKPDPKVEVCLARSPDRNDPGRIQILHYNLERFPNEITDLRGLETLLITTFMSFVDAGEDRASASRPSPSPAATKSPATSGPTVPVVTKIEEPVITPEDFEPESPNEIRVGRQSDFDERIARAIGLLTDPTVLFIIIRTVDPSSAQRALQVALGVTRHREGLGDLHQYVVEQTEPDLPTKQSGSGSSKGPRIIKLDDPAPQQSPPKQSKPPATALNIAIYLSTIQLPDLIPKSRPQAASGSNGNTPAKSEMPKPMSVSPAAVPGSKHTKISKPVAPPTLPPKVPIKSTPARTSSNAAALHPPVPGARPSSQPRPNVAAQPQAPPAPPRPPPPTSSIPTIPDNGGKGESVVKKLIAMSRR